MNSVLSVNVMTFKDEEEKIWFKAKNVASKLGHTNLERAIRKCVRDKHKRLFEETQEVTELVTLHLHTVFVLEPGVYQLIFSSKLLSATKFQDWVFEEVLYPFERVELTLTQIGMT